LISFDPASVEGAVKKAQDHVVAGRSTPLTRAVEGRAARGSLPSLLWRIASTRSGADSRVRTVFGDEAILLRREPDGS
jgi:hypothetical protein